jgi:hypothetical protein
VSYDSGLKNGPFLLRVSDPEMLRVTDELTRAGIAYHGPRASRKPRASPARARCPAMRPQRSAFRSS